LFVVLHLKNKAAEQPQQVWNAPITLPIVGVPAPVTLVLANDNDGTLTRTQVSVQLPQDSAGRLKAVLQALIAKCAEQGSAHPLAPGADVNEVYIVGGNLAIVDVNSAFAESHRSGILVEELTLASITETLAVNAPGITRMKLLVDGKERPTLAGHADLSEPYDVTFDAGRVQSGK
jgi:hypothetical protein